MDCYNGRYEASRIIWADSSGKLVEAWDRLEKKLIKVKLFSELYNEFIAEQFEQEFINYRRIRHENILSDFRFDIIDGDPYSEAGGRYFYTAELSKQDDLINYVNLTYKERLIVMENIIRAISYLHFTGVVYGKLSFSNIFISRDENGNIRVKLNDLATVRSVGKEAGKDFNITKFYVSGREADKLTEKSDIYSLGIVLFFLLTGFDYRSTNMDFTKLQLVDEKIADLILEATHLDSARRLDSVMTFWRRLAEIGVDNTFSDRKYYEKFDFRTSFVAHDRKISELYSMIKEAGKGPQTDRTVIIKSREGLGKSRFLSEMSYRLRISGLNPYFVEAENEKSESPNRYPTFTKLLRGLLKKNVLSSMALERLAPDLFHLVPDIAKKMGIDLADHSDKKISDSKIIARYLGLLNELSLKSNYVLIIDNIDNLNPNELKLLFAVVKNDFSNSPFLILSVNDMPVELSDWGLDRELKQFELSSFNYRDTVDFLNRALHLGDKAKLIARKISGICHGNPRIIELAVKQLFSFGRIKINENREWEIVELDMNISDEEARAIGLSKLNSRISSFSENARSIVSLMAVYSQKMDVFTTIKMSGLSGRVFQSAINEILSSGIILQSNSDWGNYYEFRDFRMSSLIYQYMSAEDKVKYHRICKASFEENSSLLSGAEFDSYIYHLIFSELEREAIDELRKNADRLEADGRLSEALEYYEYAISINKVDEDIDNYIYLLKKVANLNFMMGEMAVAESYYRMCQSIAFDNDNEEEEINCLFKLIFIYTIQNHYELAKEKLSYVETKPLCKSADKRMELIRLEIVLLDAMLEYELVEDKARELKELAIQNNNRRYRAISLIEFSRINIRDYKLEEVQRCLEEALKYVDEDVPSVELKDIYRLLGKLNSGYLFNYRLGEEYLNKSYDLLERLNMPWESSTLLEDIGQLQQLKGDYDSAKKYYQLAEQNALKAGRNEVLMLSCIKTIEIGLLLADYESCKIQIEKYEDLFEQSRHGKNKENYYRFLLLQAELFFRFRVLPFVRQLLNRILKDGFEHLRATDRFKYYLLKAKYSYICYSLDEGEFDMQAVSGLSLLIETDEEKALYKETLLDLAIVSFTENNKSVFDEIYGLLSGLEGYVERTSTAIKSEFVRALGTGDMETVRAYAAEIDGGMLAYSGQIYGILGDDCNRRGDYISALANYCEAAGKFSEKLQHFPIDFRSNRLNNDRGISDLFAKINTIYKRQTGLELCKGGSEKAAVSNPEMRVLFTNELKKSILKDKKYISKVRTEYKRRYTYGIFTIQQLINSLDEDTLMNVKRLILFLMESTFSQYCLISIVDDKGEIVEEYNTDKYYVSDAKDYISRLRLSGESYQIFERSGMSTDIDFYGREDNRNKTILSFCITQKVEEYNAFTRRHSDKSQQFGKLKAYVYLEATRILNNLSLSFYKKLMKNEGFMALIINDYRSGQKSSLDKLTGVLMRSAVMEKFEKLIERSNASDLRFSVLMLDIDYFKSVNDTYGHRRGDEVLKGLGNILKSSLRKNDIVGRYGGEEFIVILPGADKSNSVRIAEKLRMEVENAKLLGNDRPLTISLGQSTYPDDAKHMETLIEYADKALYYSKNNGRNRASMFEYGMEKSVNRSDKLSGIFGMSSEDNSRRMSAVLDIINLISSEVSQKEKAKLALGVLLDLTEAREAILVDKDLSTLSRRINDDKLYENDVLSSLNYSNICENFEDGTFIDWEGKSSNNEIGVIPNWDTFMVKKLKFVGDEGKVLIVASTLKEKEFSFRDYSFMAGIAPLIAAISK